MVSEQTGNFIDAVRAKFEDDVKSIEETLNSLLEEKKQKESEFEALKNEMQEDLNKVNNIISEMNTLL